ncbi:helix-turn-helix domain-containing protein [Faecalibacillus faecis]|uniref:helix-turn-helix domain-containing protein n=1 Tax=Faecalibacillus faecis TaxID=1982628 RepID=UPI0038663CA7
MFDRNKILSIMEHKGLTKYALSKLSGISQTTLGDILGGKKVSPKVDTLERIAEALEVPVTSFFDDVNDNKIEDEFKKLSEENKLFFSKYENLNPKAKKQMYQILKTFEDETEE